MAVLQRRPARSSFSTLSAGENQEDIRAVKRRKTNRNVSVALPSRQILHIMRRVSPMHSIPFGPLVECCFPLVLYVRLDFLLLRLSYAVIGKWARCYVSWQRHLTTPTYFSYSISMGCHDFPNLIGRILNQSGVKSEARFLNHGN